MEEETQAIARKNKHRDSTEKKTIGYYKYRSRGSIEAYVRGDRLVDHCVLARAYKKKSTRRSRPSESIVEE